MLTSKQRSYLMGLSAKLPTMLHIGKNGVAEGFLGELDELLSRHELVKVGVLKNSGATSRELIDEVCTALGAEPVHAIGSKIILYRPSDREGVDHVPLDEESARKMARDKQREAKKTAPKPAYTKPYRPEKKHGVHKGKGSKPAKK